MFLVEKQESYTKRVCPNNHLDLVEALTWGYNYCRVCGEELKEIPVLYSVYHCSHCGYKVGKTVIYCPYCGEKKEEK